MEITKRDIYLRMGTAIGFFLAACYIGLPSIQNIFAHELTIFYEKIIVAFIFAMGSAAILWDLKMDMDLELESMGVKV